MEKSSTKVHAKVKVRREAPLHRLHVSRETPSSLTLFPCKSRATDRAARNTHTVAARRRPQRTAPAGLVLLAEVDRTAMSEFSARGKVVVVTGGANGIGAALCRRFASEGASKVVVVDLNVGVAESLAATLPEHVGVAVGADCGSELDLRRVIVQTEFEHGPSTPHRARTPA